jgi:hypothetical protein
MTKDSLSKIIGTFVLEKYTWIEEFTVDVVWDPPFEKFRVTYYVRPEDNNTFTVNEEMNKVDELTLTLFRMLGPDRLQYLDEVHFFSK